MTTVSDFRFHVGYQGTWTKSHPVAVVNRLKVGIRDKVRAIFDEELMDSWDSPVNRPGPHHHKSLSGKGLPPEEAELFARLEALEHPEHETEAPLKFVQEKLAQVNEQKKRGLSAETASCGAQELDGCLYYDKTWMKIDSFALFENGKPVFVEATDPVSGTQVRVPLLATVIYQCEIPELDPSDALA